MAAKRRPTAPAKAARRHRAAQHVTPPAEVDQEAERILTERQELRERLGLDELDEVDRAILQIIIARPATIDREVGVLVGLSREAVNRRRNRPVFARALEEAQLDALTIIQRNQAHAARRLGQLARSSDDRIALSAASLHVQPLLRRAATSGNQDGAAVFAGFLNDAANWRKQRAAPATETAPPAPAPGEETDATR